LAGPTLTSRCTAISHFPLFFPSFLDSFFPLLPPLLCHHPYSFCMSHPYTQIWDTLEKFYAFHPRKFSLGLQLPASYRLWPPSFKAPSGRPRTRPFRKKQKSGLREVETFVSRSSQQDLDEDIRIFTHPSTTSR
jgi:hypothetical protein